MRKTDKKTDNKIRQALTSVCDVALDNIAGFKWLTHTVNYNDFPQSLSITCVFDTGSSLREARSNQEDIFIYELIEKKLNHAGIEFVNARHHVGFDTEENCIMENDGNWQQRLLKSRLH